MEIKINGGIIMNKYENVLTLMEGTVAYNGKQYGEKQNKVDFLKKEVE